LPVSVRSRIKTVYSIAQKIKGGREGKRKYNKNDFEEIKARLIHEIIEKLEITNEQTLIDEVRQKLEKFKTEKANS